MLVLEIILWTIGLYIVCGLAFAIPFVLKGVGKIDEGAHEASWGFKLIILPGTIVFWPFLLRKWIQAKKNLTMQEPHEHV